MAIASAHAAIASLRHRRQAPLSVEPAAMRRRAASATAHQAATGRARRMDVAPPARAQAHACACACAAN
ncbi:hypothetical protein DR62_07390 [Burkholderia thailandensis]|nr:hypothetical protein DR62_07390 [Burkholderia thailandensis]AOI54885.1 hypothetical protein WI24_24080 [Burkholderia thailandensis]AOJ53681.1 hypothetical protein AQ475_22960 [Burkholderia thailandensis]AVR28181.1 hypothetical protein A8H32_24940 [Burkholderia thailandensis]MDD1480650.1 hypothetical protein [Burkholderia thailandensis]